MKRTFAALLALLLSLAISGCAHSDAPPPPADEPAPVDEPAAAPAPETAEQARPDAPVSYTADGLVLPVPAEYAEWLSVELELEPWNEHWTPLASFSSRASVEAYQRDHPGAPASEEGVGWLCTVVRLDRVGLEDWLSGEQSGSSLFGADSAGRYYLLFRPTDARVYGNDATWAALDGWAAALPEEILAENGLAAYDARALLDADYTYGGRHVELGCRFPGEPMDLVLLALSQPAAQGEGGIWCVERIRLVYSEYDFIDTNLVFPVAFGVGEPAADYYARLQAECDAGEHSELLTPQGAALDYARRTAWLFGEDVSATDFEPVETLG